MRKKLIATMMAAVMTAGLITGCGSDGGKTTSGGGSSSKGGNETITLKLFSNLPDLSLIHI